MVQPHNTTVSSVIVYQCQQTGTSPSSPSSVCGEDERWSPDPSQVMCVTLPGTIRSFLQSAPILKLSFGVYTVVSRKSAHGRSTYKSAIERAVGTLSSISAFNLPIKYSTKFLTLDMHSAQSCASQALQGCLISHKFFPGWAFIHINFDTLYRKKGHEQGVGTLSRDCDNNLGKCCL